VALNDTIMAFAFAPIVGLLLGLSSITVPWTTLFLSVVVYIVVLVIAAQLWRRSLLAHGGDAALAQTVRRLQPISLVALLAMLNRSLIRIKVNPYAASRRRVDVVECEWSCRA
jgi:ACR3 family arsenite transporter